MQLTESQKLLILALSEPMLAREGSGMSSVPTSAQAAQRLGWQMTKFNRKLDNVCDKLDRLGVRGLRGGPGKLASNRRARLVEHAVLSRLVVREDLPLLDRSQEADEDSTTVPPDRAEPELTESDRLRGNRTTGEDGAHQGEDDRCASSSRCAGPRTG